MAISQKVSVTTDRKTIAPVVYAVQGDTGRQIVAEYSDFQLASGMTGVFAFTRSDGTSYSVPATIDPAANTATAEMDQALTQVGKTKGQIKITDSSGLGSTFTFYIDVQEDLSGTPTEQQYYDIQAAVEAAAEAKAEADQVLEDLGPISQINDRLTEAEAELDNKADVNGTYPSLTAGLSEQLLSSNRVTDQTPYLYRQTALGKANATRALMRKIVGGSVVWNQRFIASGTSSSNGITFTRVDNYTVTVSGTATSTAYKPMTNTPTYTGHVYLTDSGTDNPDIGFYNDNKGVGSPSRRVAIGKATEDKNMYLRVNGRAEVNETIKPQIFDLTAMFGTTIADYIYSLEQATESSGIAKLKEWGFFTKDYYDYDPGTIRSVEGVSAKITRDAEQNMIGNYPLDSSLTLRGIPKLVDNELVYDGDEYAADGTVTRNTILRAYQSGDESLANAITDGTNIVVYSANASTETAEPYTEVQVVDKDGTEEFVTSGIVPVGHVTEYPEDLVGKLDSIPNPPTAAGRYVLQATVASGKVTYAWATE